MRKFYLIVVLAFLTTFPLFSQSKLGLKFSPAIASNRVSLVDSMYNVTSSTSSLKFSLGLIYDHQLAETYYFSTGLIFVPKQVAFTVTEAPGQPDADAPDQPTQEYRLNYLQIPLSLKLYTNEIQPDTRVFFQVGLAPEIKVFDEPKEESYDLVAKFKPFDTSILFGAGAEYRAGVNTALFASITYQRGLINTLSAVNFGFQNPLYLRSTVVSLDLGIKF